MGAEAGGLHFAAPLWLWALPLPLLLWWLPRRVRAVRHQARLARYADPHLLPHLLRGSAPDAGAGRRLALLGAIWVLGVVAMAGPRLGFTDVALYRPGDSLVILLDLSRSMEVADVKPSRLARARQEIKDLLDRKQALRVGLVGFASVSHVIAPVTDDDQTLHHLMPAITTDLVNWQGSRPIGALERARRLLEAQPAGGARAILLVSDGDFASPGLEAAARALRDAGIRLHALGVGTAVGGRVPLPGGDWVKGPDGLPVISRLDAPGLRALAAAGGGVYQEADYRDADARGLLAALGAPGATPAERSGTFRIWHERYPLPVALMLALALWWWTGARFPGSGRAR